MYFRFIKILDGTRFLLTSGLFVLIVAHPALAKSTSDAASAKKALVQILGSTRGMSARFHQEVMNARQEILQTTQGEMKLQRPGKFFWHTQDPFEQKINSDGKRTWVYDVDLEQVFIQNVDPNLGETPAALLSGQPDQVVQQFDVTGSQESKGNWYFSLKPKSENTPFILLELRFNQNKLVLMALKDSLDQTTTVRFANVKLNPSFKTEEFKLSFPEGVDIIDNSLPAPPVQ